MNKTIKYSLVAGLTMAAFSLGTVPATYATEATAYVCESEGAITAEASTVEISKTATSCVLKFTFENAITYPVANPLTVEGLTFVNPAVSDYSVTYADENHTVILTINQNGIDKIKAAGEAGLDLTVSDTTESFAVKLTVEPWVGSFAYTLGTNEKTTLAEGDTIEVPVSTSALSFEVTFVNELTVTPPFTNQIAFEGLIGNTTPNNVEVDYEIDDTRHVATVTVNEKGLRKIIEAGAEGVTFVIKNSTESNTVVLKPVVDATFENDKDTIKVSETTKIVTPAIDGVTYTFDSNDMYVTIDEDGVVSVSDEFISNSDETVEITVNGLIGEEPLVSKTLTLTIKKNYFTPEDEGYDNPYEVVEGDGQTYTIDSGKTLTVKIDAPYDQVTYVEVYNKTLYDYLSGIDMTNLTDEEIQALLTEEEWDSLFFWLTEGEDYTIEEGSTVVTLTDSFLAKLIAGEYGMVVNYRDSSNIDEIVDNYAESTFTVAKIATPDTGAYTSKKEGASVNVLTTVMATVAAFAVAAIAKFAKRK